MPTDEQGKYEGWTILELFGHRKLAGYLSPIELAGAGFLRMQVPGDNGVWAAEQLYSPQAVYALTPTTEETVREMVKRSAVSSDVTPFRLPPPPVRWTCPNCQYSLAVPEGDTARCHGCYTEYRVERTADGLLFHALGTDEAPEDDDDDDDGR